MSRYDPFEDAEEEREQVRRKVQSARARRERHVSETEADEFDEERIDFDDIVQAYEDSLDGDAEE